VCIQNKKNPIFITGETGVGKSVLIGKYIAQNQEKRKLFPFNLNFSAQTDSRTTQSTIESKLEKVGGNNTFGSPGG
jgi:dynein heavy chain, axonemal